MSFAIVRFGNAVAAGTAQFTLVRKSNLAPGEKVMVPDKIAPFEPLEPGQYRLHVYLFSRYATGIFCHSVMPFPPGTGKTAGWCACAN